MPARRLQSGVGGNSRLQVEGLDVRPECACSTTTTTTSASAKTHTTSNYSYLVLPTTTDYYLMLLLLLLHYCHVLTTGSFKPSDPVELGSATLPEAAA